MLENPLECGIFVTPQNSRNLEEFNLILQIVAFHSTWNVTSNQGCMYINLWVFYNQWQKDTYSTWVCRIKHPILLDDLQQVASLDFLKIVGIGA